MDMNLFPSHMPTAASAHDAAVSQPASGKTDSAPRRRNSFSSVLRTLHHDPNGQGPDPGETRPERGAGPKDSREPLVQSGSRRSDTSQQSNAAEPAERGSCEARSCSTPDTEQADHHADQNIHTPQTEPQADSTSQGMLLALLQTPAPNPAPQPQAAAPAESPAGSLLISDHGADSSVADTTMMPIVVEPLVAAEPETSQSSLPVVPAGENRPPMPTMVPDNPAIPANRIDPSLGQSEEEPDRPMQSSRAAQIQVSQNEPIPADSPKMAQPMQPPISGNQPVPQEQPTLSADGALAVASSAAAKDTPHLPDEESGLPRLDRAFEQAIQQEDQVEKKGPVLPHSWQSLSNHDRESGGLSQQDGGAHERDEAALQTPAIPFIEAHASRSGMAATLAVGPSDHAAGRPPTHDAAPPLTPTQPLAAPRESTEASFPTLSRSVAFEVAGPELGRIHVRVAMTNDQVHTHLSSDRSEVGQFLMNGHDRLQAALQSAGLDLGQFRVDIDRQSAGRSFHQGQFHEQQGRGWQQQETGSGTQHGSDQHDGRRTPARGMLNLVA